MQAPRTPRHAEALGLLLDLEDMRQEEMVVMPSKMVELRVGQELQT